MKIWLRICYLFIGIAYFSAGVIPMIRFFERFNQYLLLSYLSNKVHAAVFPGIVYLLFGLGILKTNKFSNLSLIFPLIIFIPFQILLPWSPLTSLHPWLLIFRILECVFSISVLIALIIGIKERLSHKSESSIN